MAARSFGLLAKQKGALSPRELRSGHPRKESLNKKRKEKEIRK
jgi:hypothetical protein